MFLSFLWTEQHGLIIKRIHDSFIQVNHLLINFKSTKMTPAIAASNTDLTKVYLQPKHMIISYQGKLQIYFHTNYGKHRLKLHNHLVLIGTIWQYQNSFGFIICNRYIRTILQTTCWRKKKVTLFPLKPFDPECALWPSNHFSELFWNEPCSCVETDR